MAMANGTSVSESDLCSAYGSRLLPTTVDQLAVSQSESFYATIPQSNDLSQGFRNITYRQLAQAVNNLSWWLDEHFGHSSTFETIGYLGVADIRYAFLFLASIKCGYKLLLPSMQNPPSITAILLEGTSCTKLIYAAEVEAKLWELPNENANLLFLTIPTIDELLEGKREQYPYERSFAEAKWDPVVIFCSSGSTGPPKPILIPHGFFSVTDTERYYVAPKGRKIQCFRRCEFHDGGKFYNSFPMTHLAAFLPNFIVPIYYTAAVIVLGPTDRPPTGSLISEIMEHENIRGIFCTPTVAQQFVQSPRGYVRAKQLEWICCGGGPLPLDVGDLLSKVTEIVQLYGTTEVGNVPFLVPLRENWEYIEFLPQYGADMQPSSEGARELVLHNNPQPDETRMVFWTFPHVKEYRTRDLFKRHPTLPNLWRFYGRVEEVITLSNGKEFFPIPMEILISSHELLSGALVFGNGKPQAALLVEPKGEVGSIESLLHKIWPTIERANLQMSEHAKIDLSKIGVACPEKPFHRAAKGNVIRKLTIADYASEIERLFAKDSSQVTVNGAHMDKKSFTLCPFDQAQERVMPRWLLAFPLAENLTPEHVIRVLSEAWQSIKIDLPFLNHDLVTKPVFMAGDRESYKEFLPSDDKNDIIVRRLEGAHTSYAELSATGFSMSLLDGEVLCPLPYFPSPEQAKKMPVFRLQANFIDGGLLLSFNFHHSVFDGTGATTVMQLLAERSQKIHDALPVRQDATLLPREVALRESLWKGLLNSNTERAEIYGDYHRVQRDWLPIEGVVELQKLNDEKLAGKQTHIFCFSAKTLSLLKARAIMKTVASDTSQQKWISTHDALCALLWSAITVARHPSLAPDHTCRLGLPYNAREQRQPRVPDDFMGNMVLFLETAMPYRAATDFLLDDVTTEPNESPAFNIRSQLLRRDDHYIRSLVDSIRDLQDIETLKPKTDISFDLSIVSWAKMDLHELDFGFSKSRWVRIPRAVLEGVVFILPRRKDGGLEVVIGSKIEDMERLKNNSSFMRWVDQVV